MSQVHGVFAQNGFDGKLVPQATGSFDLEPYFFRGKNSANVLYLTVRDDAGDISQQALLVVTGKNKLRLIDCSPASRTDGKEDHGANSRSTAN